MLPGPLWNHLMAGTASLEPSVGRDRGKAISNANYGRAERYQLSRAGGGSGVRRRSREGADRKANCVGSALASAIKRLAVNGRQ